MRVTTLRSKRKTAASPKKAKPLRCKGLNWLPSGKERCTDRYGKRAARATRVQLEVALAVIEALPAKTPEAPSAQFLPKFIAKLRAKGYVQGDIVQRISHQRGE